MKYILPYKNGSKSVRALKDRLNIRSIRIEGSRLQPSQEHIIINWGHSGDHPVLNGSRVLNTPEAIRLASNKLHAFRKMSEEGVSVPPFTTDKQETRDWKRVAVRTVLTGHSARGLTIHQRGEELPDAPLYVKYIPKAHEYRVHVWQGEMIDIRRKALRKDFDRDPNWQIRSHANGFIFAREIGHRVDPNVIDESIKAVQALGLDFGAVDVVYNEEAKQSYVLEVNTAPGLEGATIDSYARKIVELV